MEQQLYISKVIVYYALLLIKQTIVFTVLFKVVVSVFRVAPHAFSYFLPPAWLSVWTYTLGVVILEIWSSDYPIFVVYYVSTNGQCK